MRMSVFVPPLGNTRIKIVSSIHELVITLFRGGINALCWPRILPGDLREVLEALHAGKGIVPMDKERSASLTLNDMGTRRRYLPLEFSSCSTMPEVINSDFGGDAFSIWPRKCAPMPTRVDGFCVGRSGGSSREVTFRELNGGK